MVSYIQEEEGKMLNFKAIKAQLKANEDEKSIVMPCCYGHRKAPSTAWSSQLDDLMNQRPGNLTTMTPQIRERSPGRPRPYKVYRELTDESILNLNRTPSDDEIQFNPELLAQSLSPTEESFMIRRRNRSQVKKKKMRNSESLGLQSTYLDRTFSTLTASIDKNMPSIYGSIQVERKPRNNRNRTQNLKQIV